MRITLSIRTGDIDVRFVNGAIPISRSRHLLERGIAVLERALIEFPALYVAVFVALYGYKREDFSDFAQITPDPFVTHPLVDRQFLHSSPLTLFLGWPLTHLVGAHAAYTLVCLGGFGLLVAVWRVYTRQWPCERRRVLLLVLLSTPLLLVLTRWIGKNDAYLLAFFLLYLRFRGPVASTALATLLVLCHKELGTLLLAGDALLRWEARPPVILGALIGNGLVSLYLHSLSEPPFSRLQLALSYLDQGLDGWQRSGLLHVLLSFGWFWMFLFAGLRPRDTPRVLAFALACFVVSLDGADYTRDFILCAFPVVVFTAERIADTPNLEARLTTPPFPLLFLVQMQIESFYQVRDTSLLSRFMGLLHQLLVGA